MDIILEEEEKRPKTKKRLWEIYVGPTLRENSCMFLEEVLSENFNY